MGKISWDEIGERFYETGIDRCVFYPKVGPGVPWNGVISIKENVVGGEIEELYFDGIKYHDLVSSEDFQATLEAYTSPEKFIECDGSREIIPGLFATQQPKKRFGLSYRTLIGNDLSGENYGYKIHLVYNATASPAPHSNPTLGGNINIESRQWTINTVPIMSDINKPTAHLVVDSTKLNPYSVQDLEDVLYGRNSLLYSSDPRLPTQSQVIDLLGNKITEPITEPI